MILSSITSNVRDNLFDELLKSGKQCERNVRWKASTQTYEINTLLWTSQLYQEVLGRKYKTKGFKKFTINERGKERHIQSVHITERVVQKALCNTDLRSQIYKRLIYDNSASQVGKGTEFALKRFREHLRSHYARYGRSGGILLIDFSDYFNSIRHKTVVEQINRYLIDELAKYYTDYFMNTYDGEVGLGLGSELCQIAAIHYPNMIDHYIKEQLRIRCYGRYMDDSYVILPNIQDLYFVKDEIIKMGHKIGITVNEKKTRVIPLDQEFIFLKKRTRITETGKILMRLDPQNIKNERRRLRQQKVDYYNNSRTYESIRASYTSWRGYARKYDYKAVKEMDKYFNNLWR